MRLLITYTIALLHLAFGTLFMLAAALSAAAVVACLLAAAATWSGHLVAPGLAPIDWLLLAPVGLASYAIFHRLLFAMMTR